MSSNFWASSHALYHLHPRTLISTSRSLDLKYCTPKQLYCLYIWFAGLIQKLGKRLMLRQIPISTAIVFFKRFYLKNSICETNPYLVLTACVFVAAKVEETPVHIKSVVSEAKVMFTDNGVKMFPAESNKLGEMEFYLLEDLDFHLVVFHPYRALLNMCGREPADGGKFPRSRIEEDQDIRKRENDLKRKRDEELRKGTVSTGVSVGKGGVIDQGKENTGASGSNMKDAKDKKGNLKGSKISNADEETINIEDEIESEEERIRRLMGRGTGEGLMEIEEGVVQICLFLINDTYRTDLPLLYPPYVIALSSLYLGFTLTAVTAANQQNAAALANNSSLLNNGNSTNTPNPLGANSASSVNNTINTTIPPQFPTSSSALRTRSSSTQQQTLSQSISSNQSLGLPAPPTNAAEFLASFEVSLPVLLSCVQDLISLYPIWEGFEPTHSRRSNLPNSASSSNSVNNGGVGGMGSLGAAAANVRAGMYGLGNSMSSMNGSNGINGKKEGGGSNFGPVEAEALVRKMIEERTVDMSHPDDAGVPQLAGRKRKA